MPDTRNFGRPQKQIYRKKVGNNYLLAIGIDAYLHCKPLKNCVSDTQAFVGLLQEFYGFEKVHCIERYNKEASRAEIWEALRKLKEQLNESDNLVIYYAGHGHLNTSLDWGYWVPVEGKPEEEHSFIRNREIIDFIKKFECYHVVLILDSCFSGAFFEETKDLKVHFSDERSRWALSSGRKELVRDGRAGTHSPFANYLLKYLRENRGKLLFSELGNKVKVATAAHTELYQKPRSEPLQIKGHEGGEFVFEWKGIKEEPLGTESRLKEGKEKGGGASVSVPHKDFWEKAPGQHKVYFSYAWGEEGQENLVDKLYKSLLKGEPSFELHRDNMSIAYGGLISPYMEEMGGGDLIVVFLSDKYFRSPYCMFELYEIGRNAKFDKEVFSQKVLPIRLEQLKLDDPQVLGGYYTYWEGEKKRWDGFLKQRMAKGNLSTSQSDRYHKIQLIEQKFGDLADWLQDINASSLELLSENDFALLKEGVYKRLAERQEEEIHTKHERAIPKAKPLGMEMIRVEGGSFMMGSDKQEREQPIHEIHVSSFYLGQYQVSQAVWEQVMGKNPSDFKGGNLPVELVNWYDCIEFCNKLSELEGLEPVYKIDKELKDPGNTHDYDEFKWLVRRKKEALGYRLPTEAEWEYAARGGKYARKTEFAGSGELKEVGWYDDFSTREKNAHNWTETSGLRIPNELGLYDMSGNVREWCWDWYGGYSDTSLKDPKGPVSGAYRVLRGGSWLYDADYCRVAYRSYNLPDVRSYRYGLRLARTVL